MKFQYDEFNPNRFEVHRLALDIIEPNSRVLDIGCATGYFAKQLLTKHCETWGVDRDKSAVKKAAKYCQKVIVSNLDEVTSLPVPKKYFDYIIMLDVLEHLLHPENLLSMIKNNLKDNGKVIVSIPNIAHASIRWLLLTGGFEYADTGILDKTHVKFYTKQSSQNLLNKCGYKILDTVPTNGMCKVPLLYKITDRLPVKWQYFIVKKIPTLFAFQFICVARMTRTRIRPAIKK